MDLAVQWHPLKRALNWCNVGDCHWKHKINTGNVLLKHVFTLDGRFDFTSLALYSLNLSGERVTGKASLMMTNEEGELKSICYWEGKVLLKRKHWHQSIIANWIRLVFKKLIITQFPLPSPWPSSPPDTHPQKWLPESQQNCQKRSSHRTINNTFQVRGTWIVMTTSDSYGTSFPLYLIDRQKSPIHHCPSTECNSASRLQSLCCSSNLYKVDTLNAPLKTPVVACRWTSYSVKESYNKNYTSVSTEISINISDNWTSVREKLPEEQKDEW